MFTKESSGSGNWNFRAFVVLAAFVVSLSMTGNLFGGPSRYVAADSGAFASSLLELSRDDWVREADANFEPAEPAPVPALAAIVAAAAPTDPIEVTKGGTTTCPRYYTVCPQVATKCEETKCPAIKTQCPVAHTTCPQSQTICPVVATKCEITVCPAVPTQCPVVATKCEFTTCPAQQTMCPVVATKCELTFCPKTTICGDEKTKCYGTSDPSICISDPNSSEFNWQYAWAPRAASPLVAQTHEQRPARALATTFVAGAF